VQLSLVHALAVGNGAMNIEVTTDGMIIQNSNTILNTSVVDSIVASSAGKQGSCLLRIECSFLKPLIHFLLTTPSGTVVHVEYDSHRPEHARSARAESRGCHVSELLWFKYVGCGRVFSLRDVWPTGRRV
jgi:hypothetical protein